MNRLLFSKLCYNSFIRASPRMLSFSSRSITQEVRKTERSELEVPPINSHLDLKNIPEFLYKELTGQSAKELEEENTMLHKELWTTLAEEMDQKKALNSDSTDQESIDRDWVPNFSTKPVGSEVKGKSFQETDASNPPEELSFIPRTYSLSNEREDQHAAVHQVVQMLLEKVNAGIISEEDANNCILDVLELMRKKFSWNVLDVQKYYQYLMY